MTTRTEIHRDYHPNGVTRRIVERVEYENGRADLHESFISESGVRYNFILRPTSGKVLTESGKVLCEDCYDPKEQIDRPLQIGDTYSNEPCDGCGASGAPRYSR
jgi:hypothetical protein